MELLVPIIPFIIIFSIVRAIVRATKQVKPMADEARRANGIKGAGQSPATRAAGMSAEKELELIRERARAKLNARMQTAREQVDFRNRGASAVPDKPVIPHSTDDCTGGSIHDGYHEGTIRRPAPASSSEGTQGINGARRGNYFTGSGAQGVQGTEGVSSAPAAASAVFSAPAAASGKRGAERLAEAIASQNSIVQGVIWSEILGRPRAEQQ